MCVYLLVHVIDCMFGEVREVVVATETTCEGLEEG